MSKKNDNDKDNIVEFPQDKQMTLPGFEQLIPPDTSEVQSPENPPMEPPTNPLALVPQGDIMPLTLQTSAETSMDLRGIQRKLASLITSEEYVSLIAAEKPEVLPGLMDSVTNGIAVADNLLIRMAQEASKNANINKVYEMLVKHRETTKEQQPDQQTDEYYDASVEKIKKAIYRKLDNARNAQKKTAKDFVNPADTLPDDSDIIEAEYTTEGYNISQEEDNTDDKQP